MFSLSSSKHLETIGETYFSHFWRAIGLSYRTITAGVILCIHAFLPDVFVNDGSLLIDEIHRELDVEFVNTNRNI
jgi:hypothetical protein